MLENHPTAANGMVNIPIEDHECPRYIALAHEDSYVDAGDDLDELVATVLQDQTGDNGEDVVVWDKTTRIAAVIVAGRAVFFRKGVRS
jgi:hypothetical protein